MLTFSAKGKRQPGRILAMAAAALLWLGPALGQAAIFLFAPLAGNGTIRSPFHS